MKPITYHQAKTLQKTWNYIFKTYITVESENSNDLRINFNSSLDGTNAEKLYKYLQTLPIRMSRVLIYKTKNARQPRPYVILNKIDYTAFLGLTTIHFGTTRIIPGTIGLTEEDKEWYNNHQILGLNLEYSES